MGCVFPGRSRCHAAIDVFSRANPLCKSIAEADPMFKMLRPATAAQQVGSALAPHTHTETWDIHRKVYDGAWVHTVSGSAL